MRSVTITRTSSSRKLRQPQPMKNHTSKRSTTKFTCLTYLSQNQQVSCLVCSRLEGTSLSWPSLWSMVQSWLVQDSMETTQSMPISTSIAALITTVLQTRHLEQKEIWSPMIPQRFQLHTTGMIPESTFRFGWTPMQTQKTRLISPHPLKICLQFSSRTT